MARSSYRATEVAGYGTFDPLPDYDNGFLLRSRKTAKSNLSARQGG